MKALEPSISTLIDPYEKTLITSCLEDGSSHAHDHALGLGIVLESLLAKFATDTALLETTEGDLVVKHVVAAINHRISKVSKGKAQGDITYLTQTVPALICLDTRRAVLRSVVWMAEARP